MPLPTSREDLLTMKILFSLFSVIWLRHHLHPNANTNFAAEGGGEGSLSEVTSLAQRAIPTPSFRSKIGLCTPILLRDSHTLPLHDYLPLLTTHPLLSHWTNCRQHQDAWPYHRHFLQRPAQLLHTKEERHDTDGASSPFIEFTAATLFFNIFLVTNTNIELANYYVL